VSTKTMILDQEFRPQVDEAGRVFLAPGMESGFQYAVERLEASDDALKDAYEERHEVVTDDEFLQQAQANFLAGYREAERLLKVAAEEADADRYMKSDGNGGCFADAETALTVWKSEQA